MGEQWEYLTARVLSPWDRMLNELGRDGWELAALLPASDYAYSAVFKRRRLPAAPPEAAP